MRVLYLGANLRMKSSYVGGTESRALGLMRGLQEAGVEVIPFMAGDEIDVEKARTTYLQVVKRFIPGRVAAALRDAYEIIFDWRLSRVAESTVKQLAPDIIWQKMGRYDQVGVRLGRKYNIPVFQDDITPIWEQEQHSDRSLKPIARYIRKRMFAQSTGLIAVSRSMEAELRSEGVPSDRIHLVPNGVDCTIFDPDVVSTAVREKYGLANKIVVGYVGGFDVWHRPDFFLRSVFPIAQTRTDIHFLLVGGRTSIYEGLQAMVREQSLEDRFTFTGSVPYAEVPAYVNAMDITVLPSVLKYMSPVKVFEYMAMQKPVVAPDGSPTVDEYVTHGKTGLLFKDGSEDDLRSSIALLADDPDLRHRLGEEGRQVIKNNFTWHHQARKLLQAFQEASCR